MNSSPKKTYSSRDLTQEKKVGFLAVFSTCCNQGRAAKAVGVDRSTVFNWRQTDEEFAAAFEEARQIGVTALEDEVHRRAFEGVKKNVYYKGEVCGVDLEYDTTLSIFLLKAHNPEKYREQHKIDLNANIRTSELSDADILAELATLGLQGLLTPSEATDDNPYGLT